MTKDGSSIHNHKKEHDTEQQVFTLKLNETKFNSYPDDNKRSKKTRSPDSKNRSTWRNEYGA